MTPRPRPGWREAALLAASLALALAGAEGVARLLWEEPSFVPRSVPPEWRDLPRVDGLFAMARAKVRGLVGGALYETNSAGFRGRERSVEKPPGVFRVAVLGDSVAMGSGATEEETYAFRLERALASMHPGRRFEVLNFALGGLNARWAVDRLVRLGLRYDPDLLVYGYTLNDIEGRAYRRSVDSEHTHPHRFAAAPFALWRMLGPRLAALRELLLPPRGSYTYELDENYFRNPEAWQEVLAALDRLAEVARERGICAVVLLHTRLYWRSALYPHRRHDAAVIRAARARGLVAIESLPLRFGESAQSLWVGPLDPHPNARGHAILLESLAAGLAELPAACWQGAPAREAAPSARRAAESAARAADANAPRPRRPEVAAQAQPARLHESRRAIARWFEVSRPRRARVQSSTTKSPSSSGFW